MTTTQCNVIELHISVFYAAVMLHWTLTYLGLYICYCQSLSLINDVRNGISQNSS